MLMTMVIRSVAITVVMLTVTRAWTPATASRRATTSLYLASASSRQEFVQQSAQMVLSTLLMTTSSTLMGSTAVRAAPGEVVTLPNGVSYQVQVAGQGPQPVLGDLVAIRFAAYYGEQQIDNILNSPEPYYTRIGSGGLLQGVEETLPRMRVGDRWILTIPGKLAFGAKGRPSSPGKPRIPADATITFEVEMVGLPGKEEELIEIIGDF